MRLRIEKSSKFSWKWAQMSIAAWWEVCHPWFVLWRLTRRLWFRLHGAGLEGRDLDQRTALHFTASLHREQGNCNITRHHSVLAEGWS